MTSPRIDSLLVYPGPLDQKMRRWVRVWAVAAPAPGLPSDRPVAVLLALERLDAKAPTQTIKAVGITNGRRPFPLTADATLAPGRYRLVTPDRQRTAVFSLDASPASSPRYLCDHSTKRPSFTERMAGFSRRGEFLGYHIEQRVESCCRTRFLAGFRKITNHNLLTVLMPVRPLEVSMGEDARLVRPGHYLAIDPEKLAVPSPRTHFPLHYRQVGVDEPVLRSVRQTLQLPQEAPFGFSPEPAKASPGILAAMDSVEAALRPSASVAGEHGVRAALANLVFHLLAVHPHRLAAASHRQRTEKPPDARLKLAIEYLQRHLAEPYNRLAVARAACVSDQHLRRLFNLRFQKSPHEYLQELRVEEAKNLLADSEIKLAAVARRVGYRDVRTFRRVFQRLTGQPSRAFRPPMAVARKPPPSE